jgi:hypothetical protein
MGRSLLCGEFQLSWFLSFLCSAIPKNRLPFRRFSYLFLASLREILFWLRLRRAKSLREIFLNYTSQELRDWSNCDSLRSKMDW